MERSDFARLSLLSDAEIGRDLLNAGLFAPSEGELWAARQALVITGLDVDDEMAKARAKHEIALGAWWRKNHRVPK